LLLRDNSYGIDPFIVGSNDYSITAGNSQIIVNSRNLENNGELMVFNLLGQLIAKAPLHYAINTINVPIHSGYCIIKICDQKTVINQKVFVK